MEKHKHTEACVWKVYPGGQQACITAKNERERALRAAGKLKKTGNPDRYRRQPEDGWEAEFGPVPLKVANRDWYDEEIVFRALTKTQTGRKPYPKEWVEIIRRFPRNDITTRDVAEATGVSQEYVSKLVALHE